MRHDWESEQMKNLPSTYNFNGKKASNIAKHSVIKEDADKGTLLENLINRLGI